MIVAPQESLDLLAKGNAETMILCGARMTGLVAIAPVFSSTAVPKQVRVALLVVLTILLHPVAVASLQGAPRLTAGTLAAEALIGLGIGLGAAMLVGAAEMAGDAAAVQMGLSGSAILDPTESSHMAVLGVFARLFAVVVLLSLDLHQVMLSAVADSFQALPAGNSVSLQGGLAAMVQIGGRLFVLGVKFAAPVIAVALITNIALAILGRAAAQLNLLTVSFPVQIAVGLFALAASLPAMARTLGGWTSIYHDMLNQIGGGLAAVVR
jgi:flagellar biosynthetic protein FliR